MKYALLGPLMLASAMHAEEEPLKTETCSNYCILEDQQKFLDTRMAQIAQMAEKLATLDDMKQSLYQCKTELAANQKEIADLKATNQELLTHLKEQEKREVQITSIVERMQGVVENVQVELTKTEQREIQNKSRFQALTARVDNFSQQIDEVQKKVSKIKTKK